MLKIVFECVRGSVGITVFHDRQYMLLLQPGGDVYMSAVLFQCIACVVDEVEYNLLNFRRGAVYGRHGLVQVCTDGNPGVRFFIG